MTARKTQAQFEIEANILHAGQYSYSKTRYTTTHTPVTITCSTHGDFLQRPNRHLQGDGCPRCAIEKSSRCKTKDLQHFLETAREVHGTKYSYEKAIYLGISNPITITCKEHGDFIQRATDHVHSLAGCPSCGNLIKGAYRLRTLEDVVTESTQVHAGVYDYSKAVFVNITTKFEVLCKRHGSFWVTPTNHIHRQSGCPDCKSSKPEEKLATLLKGRGIQFVRQQTFDSCRSPKGSKLRWDFYLPIQNLLIEYDGEQHFHPVCLGGVSEDLAKSLHTQTVEHDGIKNLWAIQQGIPLLRIGYFQASEMEEILTRTLERFSI